MRKLRKQPLLAKKKKKERKNIERKKMRYSKKTKENLEKFKKNIFKIILEYINEELDDLDLMCSLVQKKDIAYILPT